MPSSVDSVERSLIWSPATDEYVRDQDDETNMTDLDLRIQNAHACARVTQFKVITARRVYKNVNKYMSSSVYLFMAK